MVKAYEGMSTAGMNPDQGVSVELPDDMDDTVVELFPESVEEELTIDPETGEVVVEIESEGEVEEAHDVNLATLLSDEDLDKIGTYICDCVDADEKSREEWYKRFRAGLTGLGVYDVKTVNETIDAVEIKHPLLLEAATQFQARAMAELLPPNGPVKAAVYGDYTEATFEQGRRVEMFMNYQLTVEDRNYYDERDQMLFRLPFSGSEFDKQYYDPVKQRVVSRWVKAENFIVPYDTCSLESAPRYTHCLPMSANDFRKYVKAGYYVDFEGSDGSDTEADAGEKALLKETIDELQGQERSVHSEKDRQLTLYECHIEYDLPGYEDDDGIALPYIITVDKETRKVVAIYRNWREEDEGREKRVWFTHKKFLPGFGFYGFGLIHAIGALGETASQLMHILLDSGAFASLQGGFKSKDTKLKGDIVLVPGQWQDTEMTAEELARAFYTPPFKEPSQTLFSLLGMIVEGGQRFAATTETMVGDSATTGPVGTMVAQIEQGSKVFSGIHKRLHKAFGDEFIHIAELNYENLPEVYPYYVRGEGQSAMRDDFDGRVDIIPVSDPNIFSSAQRLAIAQTGMQLVAQHPDLGDRRAAVLKVLEAVRFPDPESIFPSPMQAQRLDPVSEGVISMQGRPIKAFIDQDHQAHMMVHQYQMTQMPPNVQPAMQAHIVEHAAMAYAVQMQQMLGAPMPPLNFGATATEGMGTEVPPEIEAQIAVAAAQVSQQLMQQMQQQQEADAQQQQDMMQQMQQQLQAAQEENMALQNQLRAASMQSDAAKETLRNQGKQLDLAKENLRNRGKAMDLAKEQLAERE